ncbi:MAG: peroxiredoxin family protein, partial [Blastocatellia bacterium]
MNLKKLGSVVSLILLTGAVSYVFWRIHSLHGEGPSIGKAVPDFQLTDTDGQTISSGSLRGLKYALVIFRPDCGHCKDELSQLDALKGGSKPNLTIVAASVSDEKETKQFSDDSKFELRLFLNGASLARKLGVSTVPLLMLIDEQGSIRYVQRGARDPRYQ